MTTIRLETLVDHEMVHVFERTFENEDEWPDIVRWNTRLFTLDRTAPDGVVVYAEALVLDVPYEDEV